MWVLTGLKRVHFFKIQITVNFKLELCWCLAFCGWKQFRQKKKQITNTINRKSSLIIRNDVRTVRGGVAMIYDTTGGNK